MHTGLPIGDRSGHHVNGTLTLFNHLLGLNLAQCSYLIAALSSLFKGQFSRGLFHIPLELLKYLVTLAVKVLAG